MASVVSEIPNCLIKEMQCLITNLAMPSSEKLLSMFMDAEFEVQKSEKKSQEWREKSRRLYKELDHSVEGHKEIWTCMTQALVTAPTDSMDQIASFDARSKLFFHMKMYAECVKEVDRALELLRLMDYITYKCDLLMRKMMCWIRVKGFIPRALMKEAVELAYKIPYQEISKTESILKRLKELNLQETRQPPGCGIETLLPDNYNGQPIDCKEKALLLHHEHHSRHENSNFYTGKELSNGNCHPYKTQREVPCFNDAVQLVFSDRNQLYLRSTQKLSTADIIFVEDFGSTMKCMDHPDSLMVCDHCLKFSLTPVPCHGCHALYCSEKCMDKAAMEYHAYECVLYATELGQNETCANMLNDSVRLGLRMFLAARAKCVTNERLFNEMMKINRLALPEIKRDPELKVYNGLSLDTPLKADPCTIRGVILVLIALAYRCPIFNDRWTFEENIEQLRNDPDFLFLGSLLLRYTLIAHHHSHRFVEPNISMTNPGIGRWHFNWQPNLLRGHVIAPLSSYTKHSFCQSIRHICNDKEQIVFYATWPIARDECLIAHSEDQPPPPFYSGWSLTELEALRQASGPLVCNCGNCGGRAQTCSEVEHVFGFGQNVHFDSLGHYIQEFFTMNINEEDKMVMRMIIGRSVDKLMEQNLHETFHTAALYYMLRLVFEHTSDAGLINMPGQCCKSRSKPD